MNYIRVPEMKPTDFNDPRNLGFTDEEVREAGDLGIDLGLLFENMQLTPTERACQHDAVVAGMLEIQKKVLRHDS